MSLTFLQKSNKSIKNQVIRFMILGITLMTIIISVVTTLGVNFQSQQMMLNNAYQITEGLAKQTVFSLLSGANQNAQEAMEQVQGFQSVVAARLSLEDHSDFLLSGNYPEEVNRSNANIISTHVIQETADYWLIKTPIKELTQSSPSEEDEFELDSEITEEKIIGYAEVIYSKDKLHEAQRQVATLIAIVGILSVTILSIVLRLGLLKLFQPLAMIANIMKKSQQSGEHLLAKVNGAKEIQDIASAYNNMMAVLKQQEYDLIIHRDQLEVEVDIRTKELVEARDTALIASQHKSEFMANMSHELRTPIQSIIGYGELVIEELELEGNFELIEDMDKIAKNSQRLLNMINSLLDLAKIEAGKLDITLTEIVIDELVVNLLDTIGPLAQKSHNTFKINQQCSLTRITNDKDKLEQLLLNLLSNACKFTSDGQITLTINNDDTYIYFEVQDTGIGLSQEQQSYIFDEFRQVDSSQSRKFSGTGLGLAISLRFVELMQGKITVESELDKGAKFTVILPFNS
ncbi:ATP-binding protein [Colwellia sp. 1_MG-2023]|uniref:sensor histidine kinase n=1 Tax=Colwellia sp. 1_MG-2023 TaxID=3062649 RepID=UPI0026E390EB|nr:ATP-binding protein [Colwellia sp. 1_MG-2023]MDO6446518.1 ATP-binding protein [Colwellia sp. 1_MG-2023]